MNIKKIIGLQMIGMLVISGGSSRSALGWGGSSPEKELQKAKHYAEQGEYYRARKTAEDLLKKNPANEEAKKLIATVIDEEVAQRKELFETHTPEEFTDDQQSAEIQALLERSRSLLQMGEYDEALNAAEKIFSYEPENLEASRLVDQIRQSALKDGKAEMLIRNKIARDEGSDRVGEYLKEARHAVAVKQVGLARLTLDKILLLDPENKEALEMRRQLNEHSTYETKKRA